MQVKANLFAEKDRFLANWMKALSHPARLAIVRFLASKPQCVCGDIVDELPLAQATVSQHLKALKEVGIIQGTISGPRTCYCLNPEVLKTFFAEFDSLRGDLEAGMNKDQCC